MRCTQLVHARAAASDMRTVRPVALHWNGIVRDPMEWYS